MWVPWRDHATAQLNAGQRTLRAVQSRGDAVRHARGVAADTPFLGLRALVNVESTHGSVGYG